MRLMKVRAVIHPKALGYIANRLISECYSARKLRVLKSVSERMMCLLHCAVQQGAGATCNK